MAEMHNIDPNFEPQSRPRSGTWPLNRPNIPPRRNRLQEMGGGSILDATLEEANSQELIGVDPGMLLDTPMMKDDYLPTLSPDSLMNPTDLDSVLMGIPAAPSANLVEEFSLAGNNLEKQEPLTKNNILANYCTTTTITELSNLNESQSFDEAQNMPCQATSTSANFSPGSGNVQLSKSPTSSATVSSTQSTSSVTTGATPKAKSTRKNAWGNMSYADLITQAVESSAEKRLTLAQIYEWMVKNVPYFKDKGDSNSSAGWKNSIRHNLSLHAKFKRIQNEGTGKSSWWVINHDAKPGKPARRRAISMDNANQKYNRSRSKVIAKQKAELIKKQKAGMKPGDTTTWVRESTSGLETTVSKALGPEYRQRASSNASSIGGRISPTHLFPPQDLDDDGAPPISPLGSVTNLSNLSTSLPSAFDIFTNVRPDNTSSTIPENNEMIHDNLLNSLANMDVVSSPVTYVEQQVDSKSGIYLHQMSDVQQATNRKNMGNNVAQNSPNLASLLQANAKSTPKKTSQTVVTTKREPEWNESKTPFGYDYQNQQMMNQFKPQVTYMAPNQNMQQGNQYTQQGQMQQQQQPQVNYIQQQQQVEMQQYLANQQRQMVSMDNQQPPPQYPGQESNLAQMSGKFPSDINLDNQELYDSGHLDISEMLQDDSYGFSDMTFGGKPESYYQQMNRMQESNDYNMGLNGSGLLQQQQQQQQQQPLPPVMHPNPDVFIANPGPGTTSMDLMMEGCRMNKASNFQHMQPGQTPSVGAASSYPMQ